MASSCAENQDLILFSSDREGSSDIYLMNHKGKIQDRLTENSSEDWAPVWVDQNHISFLSDRNGQAEVYRMNLITKKVEIMDQPVNCVLDDKNYVYSKRGDRLYSCGGDIFLLKKDEVRAQNLTSDLEGQANYMGWINEQEVSFTSNHEGNNEIYKLDLQKGTLTNLSKNQANDERADFSPNGTMVLFSSDRYEKGNQDIVMLDLVTGEFRRMTSTKEIELIARWSSKDDLFYFGGNGSGNWDIYSFHLPNRRISQLTQQTGFDGDPRIY
jgi:Tol biopolymer transport system component